MFDTAVLHPALKFTAVLENGPETYITRSARASNVHDPKGYHLFVAINVIILEHGKASPHCNSFLQSNDTRDHSCLNGGGEVG
nr:hypothetical protein Iba_chr15aCG9510 [Ipomoea batatas]GME09714.1 hypothetical protein Iba_scaffold9072CG0040 [Ipomoea batatas]